MGHTYIGILLCLNSSDLHIKHQCFFYNSSQKLWGIPLQVAARNLSIGLHASYSTELVQNVHLIQPSSPWYITLFPTYVFLL